MQQTIANVWYNGKTLYTEIVRDSKVITSSIEDVHPDCLTGILLRTAINVDKIIPRNFRLIWEIDNARRNNYDR